MKRQRFHADRGGHGESLNYNEDNAVPLNRITTPKRDQILAQVQEGDTLQAICLRYNCSLAELKRLNKIEKEIEIHARSTLRIPVTPFTVLLETLPGVHSSGNSSPKHACTAPSSQQLIQNPLLDEKLFIASVSNAPGGPSTIASPSSIINDIILESTITPSLATEYHDVPSTSSSLANKELHARVPLLSGDFDDAVPQPRIIPVRHRFDISFDGADCDMSWVCLFVCILLLCVAIPLIYVLWTVEHPHHPHDDNSTKLKSIANLTSHINAIKDGTSNVDHKSVINQTR